MIKKIIVEVPLSWCENPIDGEKNRTFISNFIIQLSRFNIPIHFIKVPYGADISPRNPEKGVLIFSYHSHSDEKNVWHLKESPVIPLYSIDKSGYSGWAHIANHLDQYPEINEIIDSDSIINKFYKRFETLRISKYPQSDVSFTDVPTEYVFFPLQVQTDPVSQLARVNAIDMLYEAAHQANKNKIFLLVKKHPFCNSLAIDKILEDIIKNNEYVKRVNHNVHLLIKNSRAVITVNSGVGIEALIDGAAVYASGTSEWSAAANAINTIEDIADVFTKPPVHMNNKQKKILAYLLNDYWVEPDNFAQIDDKIQKAIADFDHDYGILSEITDTAEVFLPLVLDMQGRLECEFRRAQLAELDADKLSNLNDKLSNDLKYLKDNESANIAAINELEGKFSKLDSVLEDKNKKLGEYIDALKLRSLENEQIKHELNLLRETYHQVLNSRSWRLTSPLRKLLLLIKKLKN